MDLDGTAQLDTSTSEVERSRADIDGTRPAALVREFHNVYQMPDRVRDSMPSTLDFERIHLRMGLIAEETSELFAAVYGEAAAAQVAEAMSTVHDQGTRDVIEAADALADLVYVIYGMALEAGIDLDQVLAEVHSSNLSKLMPDGSVLRREDGKVLKGPNFREPDIRSVLAERDRVLSARTDATQGVASE